jgi:hypothetical protein
MSLSGCNMRRSDEAPLTASAEQMPCRRVALRDVRPALSRVASSSADRAVASTGTRRFVRRNKLDPRLKGHVRLKHILIDLD